jgi:D-3-phosphoglycerate dehydrogenase/(S)-sulfolactate dehydrogenase
MSDGGAPTVVVTYPGFDDDDERTAGALRAAGLAIRLEPRVNERTPAEVIGFMHSAVAGIVSTDPFDREVFAACPRLRALARVGVGFDAIDLEAATEAGVAVMITPGLNSETVADHTLALMLACVRRIVENDASVRRGEWDRGGRHLGTALSGATVGLVGLGTIGRAVSRRLVGFGVRQLGYDVVDSEVEHVTRVDLGELLRESDIVSLHVPLGAGTHELIGEPELALLRNGAILVNAARGRLVHEGALVRALRDGRLAAAGLDVFAHEPPRDSPLLALSNVVLSPHIGGIGAGAQQAMLEMAVSAVLAVLAGMEPGGLVNPQVLTHTASGAGG